MSEAEKAVVRAVLIWHVVDVIAPHRSVRALAGIKRAARTLLKAHPRKTYAKAKRVGGPSSTTRKGGTDR